MMQTLLAWVLVALLMLAAYPTARRLLAHSPHGENSLLALTIIPGLAFGLLTLIMFWESLLGVPWTVVGIALPYVAILAAGYGWLRAQPLHTERMPGKLATPGAYRPRVPLPVWIILVLVAAAVLLNALYWPFSRDDALAIYRPLAQIMAETRALVPLTGADSLYRAYPMHIPLAYAFVYLASGWENEYLARLIPALLSVACLPATCLLGRRAWPGSIAPSVQAGSWAALLLAWTPFFARWASAGYVDLPMAYFFALTVLFCARLRQSGAPVDALLAGLCLGLAAWTKNAALLIVPLFGVWLVYAWRRRHVGLRAVILAAGACAGVAAPWYVRNLLGAGFVMPQTAWIDQAQPTLAHLFPFLTQTENFGISGWIMTAGIVGFSLGVVGAGLSAFRSRQAAPAGSRLLLWFILPYMGVWWLLASYDPRFLLHVLPLACALGGAWLAQAWAWVGQSAAAPGARGRALLRLGLAVAALFLTAQTIWQAVEFKSALLADPFMSHAEKIDIVRPGVP